MDFTCVTCEGKEELNAWLFASEQLESRSIWAGSPASAPTCQNLCSFCKMGQLSLGKRIIDNPPEGKPPINSVLSCELRPPIIRSAFLCTLPSLSYEHTFS